MSQNDFSLANADGATFRADLNSALQALASASAGLTAPLTTYQYQLWFDTTTNILKIRNGANTAWVNVASLVSGTWKLYEQGTLLLERANVWTALQEISLAAAGLGLRLTSSDAGAALGPLVELFRDSASPAAADLLGGLDLQGRSSTGVKRALAQLYAEYLDPTNTSEDAKWVLATIVAGTLAPRWNLGHGIWAEGATGGDPGDGKVNAKGFQINGVAFSQPGLNLLSTATASASASVDFTDLDSTYDHYIVDCINVRPANDDVNLWLRMSDDNGSTFKSGGSDYTWVPSMTDSDTGGNENEAEIILNGRTNGATGNRVGNATGEYLNARVHVWSPAAVQTTTITAEVGYVRASSVVGKMAGGVVAGRYKTAAAIDAIRFLMQSGNIAEGQFKLYGVTK